MTDDTRRSDAIWELLGDHLAELVEARRKLKALAEYRDDLKNSDYYPHDETTAYAVEVLTEILDGDA